MFLRICSLWFQYFVWKINSTSNILLYVCNALRKAQKNETKKDWISKNELNKSDNFEFDDRRTLTIFNKSWSYMRNNLEEKQPPGGVLRQQKMFWKYAPNLKENTHVEVWFQKSSKATLLKSHFGIGVLQ